ncbi:oligoribonuclease [Engelhardtia mirabilis]|uniref:Oligoribonuclease n=1 Tax=Engelhardtia mirabilis TaxID=2528011 RepID=A0A518BHE9_9BACT|nr:Oligoribonuclease [Planctomycetes bacterium Pla133]QDV00700.1 Oligoribonuclease [Planctomycetes bacterium Pla86]
MAKDSRAQRIVWIDLEMSGLDPEVERILEAAVLVTDGELEIIAEGPELVVHQDDALLAAMDAWNTEHHGASGLTERVRQSTVSEQAAEDQLLAFIAEHCDPNTAPLAGNSVWQDRRFLTKYMGRLESYLHYRLIDVSTIKELARRWHPDVFAAAPAKREAHRALDDIRESLEELRYYRRALFDRPPTS